MCVYIFIYIYILYIYRGFENEALRLGIFAIQISCLGQLCACAKICFLFRILTLPFCNALQPWITKCYDISSNHVQVPCSKQTIQTLPCVLIAMTCLA